MRILTATLAVAAAVLGAAEAASVNNPFIDTVYVRTDGSGLASSLGCAESATAAPALAGPGLHCTVLACICRSL